MAIKTRQVTQYQLLTVVNIVREKKNNRGAEIARRELIACFDDRKNLDSFVDGTEGIEEFDVMEEWVEIKPAQSNYSLPFNPKAGEVELAAKKAKKK